MRIVPASMLAVAIAASAAACSSSGSGGSGTSGATSPSGTVTSLSGTPDQIVQKAVNNLKAATSVEISGNVVSSGSNIKLDLTDATAGCKGTITLVSVSSSNNSTVSGTADLIEADSIVYMKLDQSFFKNLSLPSSLFTAVTGKYIKVTTKSELADFAQLCDPSSLASGFDKEITGFVKNGTGTVNGQAVESLKQPTHAGSGIVYVSQSSTPEIVRLQGPSNEGQIDFTNYNAPVTITAPPASEVIDGSKFGL
jgi:hypothetical protein